MAITIIYHRYPLFYSNKTFEKIQTFSGLPTSSEAEKNRERMLCFVPLRQSLLHSVLANPQKEYIVTLQSVSFFV